MKKLFVLFPVFAVMLAFIACHKKAVPEISSRTSFPPAPKSAQQAPPDNSPEAIAAGKRLFETRCNRCHDLKDTKGYTADRWATILKSMIPKARLNEVEGKEVTAFVMANAAK